MEHTGYLPALTNRESYMDLLEGYGPVAVDGSGSWETGRTLLKGYMLETARNGRTVRELPEAFPEGVSLEGLDDALFRVHDAKDHGGRIVGLLERLDDRHPVFYTTMQSAHSDRWVRNNVDKSPWLDRVWLSSHMLLELWNRTKKFNSPYRYVRLGFEYDGKFETITNSILQEKGFTRYEGDDEYYIPERRRSYFHFTDQLYKIEDKLGDLMNAYELLNSLVQLQMPASHKGGHLLYFDGKTTNRSDSFLEHRSKLISIINMYKKATETAEEKLWFGATGVEGGGYRFDGAPVIIQFDEPLSEATFDRFVKYGLKYKNSKLRIGGYPRRLGPTKVHLTAIDYHLWQPFLLEATAHHIMVLLPRGTCGNTVHRLVTYIQRSVSPKVKVWLGSHPYENIVGT